MIRAAISFPALLFVLAACEPLPPAAGPGPGGGSPDTCGAARVSAEFVGQEASTVTAAMFAAPVRIIHPGDMVTMDFNPERLNFEVDAGGRITRVYCG